MSTETWLLLIHQIPAKPLYLRARIRTLLGRAGAVALKNSVYALPQREGGRERLEAVSREIRRGGGEAFVCEVRFTDPKDGASVLESYREQCASEYRRLRGSAEELRAAMSAAGHSGSTAPGLRRRLTRLQKELERSHVLDYFGAEGRKEAQSAFQLLERRMAARPTGDLQEARSEWAGRTWVTRRGVHVDRIACAWFIRRFLDPRARFRFVGAAQATLRSGEIGFDLPGGQFTHEGDRCSFETLLAKSGRSTPALEQIAAIVHDIDLKDGKFENLETAGVERLLGGILAAHPDDEARLERGTTFFDDLHRSFARPPTLTLPKGPIGRRPGGRRP